MKRDEKRAARLLCHDIERNAQVIRAGNLTDEQLKRKYLWWDAKYRKSVIEGLPHSDDDYIMRQAHRMILLERGIDADGT